MLAAVQQLRHAACPALLLSPYCLSLDGATRDCHSFSRTAPGQARESLDRSVCWPASWVAKEIPDARLLSLEYAAPASGWEVHCV